MSGPAAPGPAPAGEAAAPAVEPGFGARLKAAWDGEFGNFRWRLMLGLQFARLLPEGRAAALRASLLRAIGPGVGPGTRVLGMPRIQWSPPGRLGDKLRIGAGCTIGAGTILEFGELLTIGDRVTLEEGVVILTTTHQLGPREHRAGPLVRTPVTIGHDAHVGARAILLPGATIGEGARVLADSVVTASVAAGATVSGIPARPLRPA